MTLRITRVMITRVMTRGNPSICTNIFFTVDVVKYICEKLKSLVGNVAICGRIVSIFDGGEEQHS